MMASPYTHASSRPSSSPSSALRLLVACILLCSPAWAQRTGKPQVWDGGKWHDYNDALEPGELLPYPPKTDSYKRNETTILLLVSSFRDYRCPKTLFNLFTKADHPERVFAGVVQQNDKDDPDCLWEYCVMMKAHKGLPPVTAKDKPDVIVADCPFADHVKMMRVSHEEAKGPTYGRYLGSKLVGDEEFCMQTDAHMDFLYSWDTLLLDMWGLVQNEYAILSTYVPRLQEMAVNTNERWEVPALCRIFFTPGDRMVRNEQAKALIWFKKPKMTTTWAAGLSFSKCHAERRVPYDPHLPSIFDGEEYSRYARFWTSGYDVYTPHRSIVFHDYDHGSDTVKAGSWTRRSSDLQKSNDRLRTLLGMPDATVPRNSSAAHELLRLWDLGTKRSLDQLIDFTGVDTRTYNVFKSTCGKLSWVPFEEWGDNNEGVGVENGDPMVATYTYHRQMQRAEQVDGLPPLGEALFGGGWQYLGVAGMASVVVVLALLVSLRKRRRPTRRGLNGGSNTIPSPHEALVYPLIRQFSPEKAV